MDRPELDKLCEKYVASGEAMLKSVDIINMVRPTCEPVLQDLIDCVFTAKQGNPEI